MNPSLVQRPQWYRGDLLPRSRAIETKTFGELSGHVLDEIIQEKLKNPEFVWKDLLMYLGLSDPVLRGILQRWNQHKKLLATIPPETAATDQALQKILGKNQAQRLRCWKRYRNFIDNGGCPEPVNQALLFGTFISRTP
jgi:hypothetical protein